MKSCQNDLNERSHSSCILSAQPFILNTYMYTIHIQIFRNMEFGILHWRGIQKAQIPPQGTKGIILYLGFPYTPPCRHQYVCMRLCPLMAPPTQVPPPLLFTPSIFNKFYFNWGFTLHSTLYSHIMTGSFVGRGNQYIQLVKVLYCKLLTISKQLPTFPT